jgi:outer membrane receptor for ferrienterochelin and colicins
MFPIDKKLLFAFLILFSSFINAQDYSVYGKITDQNGEVLEAVTVIIPVLKIGSTTNALGHFNLKDIPKGTWEMEIRLLGFKKIKIKIEKEKNLDLVLESISEALNGVVITGTMKELSRADSPIPIEVYTPKFFRANPTPSLFEGLQNINGVRPQINCNVCNTGDIHINGLEGPYTMVLIDGMPLVSGLSTVYGLNGIPQSLIERVEVVKGPASTLYGSEAVGGLINIITKRAQNSPSFSTDIFGTGWGELNIDLATKFSLGKKIQSLLGVNYFNYQTPIDNNNDNFTDLTLQNRISVFNKWDFQREGYKLFSLAGRYIYEDRWGGEMDWTKEKRGSTEIYGESIYTKRWELFGTYQLPMDEKFIFQFSANGHHQNSYYGDMLYDANQNISFAQLTWFKTLENHELLLGTSYRHIFYDDNTPATADARNIDLNRPVNTSLPGIFFLDEYTLNNQNKLLLGMRYDYNSTHGNIFTPRVNYKWNSIDKQNTLRLSVGNGYRVANIFTEDHAALTGAREVVFINKIKPETSWNGNLNYVKKLFIGDTYLGLDSSAFYTYFNNKIIPDYETDPNKIIYNNLEGFAVSKGVSLNIDLIFPNGLKLLAGVTAMDVYSVENNIRERQLFTEKLTATWNLGYTFKNLGINIDYTGNLYSPMRLPLLSDLDPRTEFSPWWSIQNLQITKRFGNEMEVYFGGKNLLNWTPDKGNPFIIARSEDPFDKNVTFDNNGQALATPDNPYGLSFDPTYVFGPNQGFRMFLGFRYQIL